MDILLMYFPNFKNACTEYLDILNETIIEQFLNYKLLVFFISIILIFGLFYWMLYVPYIWIKDITDAGYIINETSKNYSKKEAINRMRRVKRASLKFPPPFPNGWYALAESRDLKTGQAISVNCVGENFVVFRSEYGEAFVLDAYCPHLGANLGIGGKVRGDCIECPFHNWTFRGSDGVCNNVPYSTNSNIPALAKVKKWISREVNDIIFVWYHAENEEPWEIPQSVAIQAGESVYHGHNEFLVSCHIQDIPENGADFTHFEALHKSNMLSGTDLRSMQDFWSSIANHGWNLNWQISPDKENSHVSLLDFKHSFKLFNKLEIGALNINGKQYGPGYVQLEIQSSYGHIIMIQTVTPLEPMVQKVLHRFYAHRSLGLLMKVFIYGESVMFERDMMVWNNKIYKDSPLLMKEEKAMKTFRNWYSQFYSENSVSFAMARENISW